MLVMNFSDSNLRIIATIENEQLSTYCDHGDD
jgi:hypothetical protein